MDNIQVLFEDNHLIAINKPAGWLVQGDATGDATAADWVKGYIKERYNKPGDVFLGIIHRLDRPVSGVVVYARTTKALTRMNQLFKERNIAKKYWAITGERPNPLEGSLKHFLFKDKSRNKATALEQISKRHPDAKESTLNYKLIGEIGDHHLLEVNPITGRPHQIRVQLSKMGWPIRGDLKYGYAAANTDGSICLHCRSLSFMHPVKKEPVTITADPPDLDNWRLFEGLINEGV